MNTEQSNSVARMESTHNDGRMYVNLLVVYYISLVPLLGCGTFNTFIICNKNVD